MLSLLGSDPSSSISVNLDGVENKCQSRRVPKKTKKRLGFRNLYFGSA